MVISTYDLWNMLDTVSWGDGHNSMQTKGANSHVTQGYI